MAVKRQATVLKATDHMLQFVARSYREDEGYLCQGTSEPESRSIDVELHTVDLKWHIKVTFEGLLQSSYPRCLPKTKPKRKKDLQELCAQICFGNVPLLNDTVTEVVITLASDDKQGQFARLPLRSPTIGVAAPESQNQFAAVIRDLRFRVQEDASRVLYPRVSSVAVLPKRWLSTIEIIDTIGGKVDIVQVAGDVTGTFIYKKVERPFYEQGDTAVFQQEVENMQLCRGVQHVVQPVAVVVSRNPYQTSKIETASDPVVIRGVLVEYHSRGTLRDALTSPAHRGLPWQRWPLQIAIGLSDLHLRGIAHMDIKPENIVISAGGDAVIIDIGGMGFTREWLAPEMANRPLSRPLRERMQNDIWAFGKILSSMAEHLGNGWEKRLLRIVAAKACIKDPDSRITLSSASTMLARLAPTQDQ
ncbi:protein kinase [Diplogelasinospora grovesii]|uniref:Protein kinase n=1 Tax=Diplogelasinospora grovesii TaxID=303347 RepID=A0AAN6MWD2_9PEZI|nr:protein kinase [Diplogelasinospora grovesii]